MFRIDFLNCVRTDPLWCPNELGISSVSAVVSEWACGRDFQWVTVFSSVRTGHLRVWTGRVLKYQRAHLSSFSPLSLSLSLSLTHTHARVFSPIFLWVLTQNHWLWYIKASKLKSDTRTWSLLQNLRFYRSFWGNS